MDDAAVPYVLLMINFNVIVAAKKHTKGTTNRVTKLKLLTL